MNKRTRYACLGSCGAVLLIAVAVWLNPRLPVDDAAWDDRYNRLFRKHGKHYFGVWFDWRWFKAQAIAESALTRNARSDKGALGIMQILPVTFKEVFKDHVLAPAILDPKWNIPAGIAVNRRLYERWTRRVPPGHRLAFTWASYNAGYRSIANARSRARKKGRNDKRWPDVAHHVPRQTRLYVRKINRLMRPAG